MDLQLAGKSALVTGGSGEIGRAIAETLLEEGTAVVLAARTTERLESTRNALLAPGRRVHAYACDTTDPEDVARLVDFTVDRTGSLDVLVNAAASPGTPMPHYDAMTADASQFTGFVATKLLGYLLCAQAAAPVMVRNHWGRIINIGGMSFRTSGSVFGSARNAAVVALTKNLADALGGQGVNVTAVHPGLTETARLGSLLEQRAQLDGLGPAEVMATFEERTLIGHLPSARDIAHIVAFLSSPLSVAINGDSIPAMGGAWKSIHY